MNRRQLGYSNPFKMILPACFTKDVVLFIDEECPGCKRRWTFTSQRLGRRLRTQDYALSLDELVTGLPLSTLE